MVSVNWVYVNNKPVNWIGLLLISSDTEGNSILIEFQFYWVFIVHTRNVSTVMATYRAL